MPAYYCIGDCKKSQRGEVMSYKPYKTVNKSSEEEIIINKSRFIGRAFHVESEEEALSILAAIRKQHYDATHNCYAYIIREGGAARFSDDGEPSGTAGMPMMEVLKAKGVTDTLVIVTRYFGGILLGAGGLVRAYSRSTTAAVDAANVVLMTPGTSMKIVIDYSRFNAIEDFIRANCVVENIEYMENITLLLTIESEKQKDFSDKLTEKTDGKIVPEVLGEVYMKVAEA